MEEWAQEAVELWRASREPIAKAVLEGIEQNPHLPVKKYTLDDLLQMVDGAGAMIVEELEGAGTDIRDVFINSVWPGIFAQGQPLSALVGQMTMNAVLVYNVIVPQASEKNREKIGRFYINFYVKLNLDIVKVGLECGVTS